MKVLIYCLLTKLSKVLVSFFRRERHRERDTQRETERDRETERQRETETERDSATIHNRCDRSFVS